MANELRTQTGTMNPTILESLVLKGDLSGLNPQQKVEFYNYRCSQAGLDPAAKPFDLLTLNGKQILYANASATQQLIANHGLSVQIVGREKLDDIYCVHVRVTGKDQRSSDNMGAVSVKGITGEPLANAFLKSTTKAIRRCVLAHLGLGMLDETEVETIPGAVVERIPVVEITRPGDSEPVEPATEPGWSDDDYAQAKQILMDLAETLDEAGYSEDDPKHIKTIKTYRDLIGDESCNFRVWANRVATACQRVLAAKRPAQQDRTISPAGNPGSATPSPQTKSPTGPVSSPAPVSNPELLSDRALGDFVSANWPLIHQLWDQQTADGRKLQARHRENRTKQKIEAAAPGLAPGSREWLLAVADMQIAELANAKVTV